MDLKRTGRDARKGRQREGGRQPVVGRQYHGQGGMQMVNRNAARVLVAPPNLGFTAP
jgi:hypothetical protein